MKIHKVQIVMFVSLLLLWVILTSYISELLKYALNIPETITTVTSYILLFMAMMKVVNTKRDI